jgi:dTDP-4-dehydrorhamnose 3,5-epimerase
MKFLSTPLAGVWQVHGQPHTDARGSFTRLYCAEAFDELMPGLCFVQANLSVTRRRGTVRGLHLMRAPAQEFKLVRCLRGRVFDVAADLRRESATYGRWFALELAEDQPVALLIPPGVAHGFQALDDDAQLLYQHSTAHVPALDDGVHVADARLGIRWPLPVSGLSPRDARLPGLAAAEVACAP